LSKIFVQNFDKIQKICLICFCILYHKSPQLLCSSAYTTGTARQAHALYSDSYLRFNMKFISRWGRRTLPPKPRHGCKSLPPALVLNFSCNVHLSHRRIV